MSVPATPAQEFFVNWLIDMKKILDEYSTWYNNQLDINPNYNFAALESEFTTLRNNLMSELETLQAAL